MESLIEVQLCYARAVAESFLTYGGKAVGAVYCGYLGAGGESAVSYIGNAVGDIHLALHIHGGAVYLLLVLGHEHIVLIDKGAVCGGVYILYGEPASHGVGTYGGKGSRQPETADSRALIECILAEFRDGIWEIYLLEVVTERKGKGLYFCYGVGNCNLLEGAAAEKCIVAHRFQFFRQSHLLHTRTAVESVASDSFYGIGYLQRTYSRAAVESFITYGGYGLSVSDGRYLRDDGG